MNTATLAEQLTPSLAHGARIVDVFERAISAQEQAQRRSCKPAQQLTANEEAAEWLPAFGFVRQQVQSTEYMRTYAKAPTHYEAWMFDWYVRSTWTDLCKRVAATINRTPQADGTLLETIDIVALEAARRDTLVGLTQAQRDAIPMDAAAQAIVTSAALAAAFPGIPWSVSPDGNHVTRILPNHPLRIPAHFTPLSAFYGSSDRRTRVPCLAWAALPVQHSYTESPHAEIVYFSGVGYQKILRGMWAAIMDRKRSLIELPLIAKSDLYRGPAISATVARRLEGKQRYRAFWPRTPLPASGLAHLVIEANESGAPRSGKPFIHVVGLDGTPDWAWLQHQFSAALRVPFRAEWLEQMWQLGSVANGKERPQLISKLPSFGCTAYWVEADNDAAWGRIVSQLAGATISDPRVGMEIIGTLETTIADERSLPELQHEADAADEEPR